MHFKFLVKTQRIQMWKPFPTLGNLRFGSDWIWIELLPLNSTMDSFKIPALNALELWEILAASLNDVAWSNLLQEVTGTIFSCVSLLLCILLRTPVSHRCPLKHLHLCTNGYKQYKILVFEQWNAAWVVHCSHSFSHLSNTTLKQRSNSLLEQNKSSECLFGNMPRALE